MSSTSDLFWQDVEAAALATTSIPATGADDMTFHGSIGGAPEPTPGAPAAPVPAFDFKMLALIVLVGVLLNAIFTGRD